LYQARTDPILPQFQPKEKGWKWLFFYKSVENIFFFFISRQLKADFPDSFLKTRHSEGIFAILNIVI